MNGIKDWKMFSSPEEAKSATDEMIARNRKDFPWIDSSRDVETTVLPLLTSKFFYVNCPGSREVFLCIAR